MANPDSNELASWKEIAAHLGVAVRTAQLWERERHLPVHRLPGGRGRVLAHVAELEQWKTSAAVDSPEPPPQAPSPVERRRRLGVSETVIVVLLVGCAAVLTGVAARTPHRDPFAARVERDTLVVLDGEGRELWRRLSAKPLAETARPELAATSTWVGDLDDDGRTEVLFSPHPVTPPAESLALICYDSRGNERWTFRNRRRVRSATEVFSGVYGVAGFVVVRLGIGRRNAILVSTTHEVYYPSQVALLSPDGRVLREYWHSGHLNHLRAADLNGDGQPEFYLAGINNARHAATVVVLDEAHFDGASQEPPSDTHQLLDLPRGVEVTRLLVPQTCLSRQVDPYNVVASFSVSREEVVVGTLETLGTGAGVYHHLSSDFRERRASISDGYRIEHRRGILDHRFSETSCPLDDIPDIEFVHP